MLFIFLFFFCSWQYQNRSVALAKKTKTHRSRLHHELVELFQDHDILTFLINVAVTDQWGNEEEGIVRSYERRDLYFC